MMASLARIGLPGFLVLLLVLPGCTASEADSGMPPAERAYWDWISSINRAPETALATGQALLRRHPELHWLYLRLADVCREQGAVNVCRTAFAEVVPPDTLSALYREAGRIRLLPDSLAGPRWQRLAAASALDPGLARRLVDAGLAHATWLPPVEAAWKAHLDADSTAAGPAFGLGYAAVLRQQWGPAERWLRQAARHAPDDPEAYRELGRLYFMTSRLDAFQAVLERGIEAARNRHDLQTELILRGNLGWGIVLQNGDLQEAARVLTTALAQSRALADGESEAFNLYRLANIDVRQQHYREALARLIPADTLYARYNPRQHPEVQVLRATALKGLFRFSDAEALLTAAVADARAQHNLNARLNGLVVLAELQYQMGRYTRARQTALEALETAQRYQAAGEVVAARLVLGDVEHRWGNFDAAMAQYEAALDLARDRRLHTQTRRLYQRLGRTALSLRDPARARAHFDAFLQQEQAATDSLALAEVYTGLGRVYMQFGNPDEAARYFREAERHLPRTASARQRFDLLLNEAWEALNRQAYDDAGRALAIARTLLGQNLPEEVYTYRWELAQGELDLALGDAETARQRFDRVLRWEQAHAFPDLRWRVLDGLARTAERLGHDAEAEAHYRDALAVTETMRGNLYSRERRAAFIQDKVDLYKGFAAFLEARNRLAEAFYYTEAIRSRSLVDLLFTTQQDRSGRGDDATGQLIEAERRRQAIARTLAEDAGAAEPTRVADLRRAYREADSLYRAGVARLPQDHLLRTLLTHPPLTAAETRALLAPDEAVLAYSLRDTAVVAFLLTPDTLRLEPLAVAPTDLSETIRFFRDQLAAPAPAEHPHWRRTSRRLYDQLLAPVLRRLPPSVHHLHLIPEGTLYYLPFAALLDERERFLVERVSLSVTPSAGLLAAGRAVNPGRWQSLLVVADPEDRLPGTRHEADALTALPGVTTHSLTGDRATPDSLFHQAAAYDILHIATHGRFVPDAPWSSHLELHGGTLNVADIGRLNLHAYLVTLSACETALSGGLTADVPSGDEWVGLNQAFLAAGTPSVLSTLWPIDDAASATFMSGFYTALLQTRHKARALARIQRAFLRDPHTRHPFFWAPFTLIGDPR